MATAFNAQDAAARRATFGAGAAIPLGTTTEDTLELQRETWNQRDPHWQAARASSAGFATQPPDRPVFSGASPEVQPPGAANASANASAAAASAIKVLQEKNYRLECDLQVMDNLLKEYKIQTQELEEQVEAERQRTRLTQPDGHWSRERDDLKNEVKQLRQMLEKTKQDAEKEVKESQVEAAHLRNLNKMLDEEITAVRAKLNEG